MLNGIINVYKEPGFTSHDVVAKMRGICRQKKVGHTGTLDPAATGVLPVCLGTGTKLCDMLTEKDKEYVTELLLGVRTDTQDMTGTILETKEVTVKKEEIEAAVMSFLGDYDQVPPMYSALKVNGKKLYELAREGKEIERSARRVKILELEILGWNLPEVKLRVVCSKGTYIRTLCEDIGNQLGCGAAMKTLERTRVGIFGKDRALTLEMLEKVRDEKGLESVLFPVESAFEDAPRVNVLPEFDKQLRNGNRLNRHWLDAEKPGGEGALLADVADGRRVRMCTSKGEFLGLYEACDHGKCYRPVKMFLEQ